MQLVQNASEVAKKAWSIRLALLAAILSAIETAMQLFNPADFGPWFGAAAMVVGIAAALARIVAQPATLPPPVQPSPDA
jgi:hypothetical protein